ncbi:phosphorylase [Leptospira langatensis]|uniref:Phosphorylase n=1 Tax=Leptospira langatensis TaxID=2484983 RepID=A0A5F1ZXU2_9LEPT|nr:phosphorylase [Leptospira langatensis]TGK04126.1 phosphorylase [Leptospira langatensis]TGL43606.1 phosphorylase [Leptospira langatensis]
MGHPNFQDILFCGAFSGEIDKLKSDSGIWTFETGVGDLEAAINLQKYLSQNDTPRPKAVISVGSAGVYSSVPRKDWEGKFGISRLFVNYEIAYLDKKVRIPDSMNLKYDFPDFEFPFTGPEFLELATNGTGSVTLEDLSPRALERIKTEGIGFENMEAFGLAKVCKTLGIPFGAIYALTNKVGPKGSEEWKLSWRKHSDRLQERILHSD